MNEIILNDIQEIYKSNISWKKFCNKVVLITGAYGSLASYLVYTLIYLNEQNPSYNVKIIALGRSEEKMQKRFNNYINKSYFSVLYGDVCNHFDILGEVHYIIHGASLASPQYYGVDPIGTMMPNILGTYNLLELAREKKVEGFLFLSTGLVYGTVGNDISKIREDSFGSLNPLEISSCYGESKRMGEAMCGAWHQQYGVNTTIVRIHHTYGPTLDIKNDQRAFSEFINSIVVGNDILLKSAGNKTRSFCYIADATKAFFKILLEGKAGEAYNMSNNKCNISIRELANLLVGLFPEKNLEVRQIERTSNDVYTEVTSASEVVVDTTKLQELGWSPLVPINEGFKRTIQSFMYNGQ